MPDRKYALVRVQAAALRDAIGKFTSTNAAIARVEEVRAKLAYAGNAESVEQGLQELGELLGATSSRPEKETGRGPDVLWLCDGIGFCIEAKSEKQSTIFKADAEQLLLSVEWCVEQVKLQRSDVVPIFVTNSTSVDRQEDVSFRPAIVKESMLIRIVDALSALITGMSFDGPLFSDVTQINERLHMAKITGKEIARQLDRI